MSRFILFLCFSLLFGGLYAQKQSQLDVALRHLEKNLEKEGLNELDVTEMEVTSSFKSINSKLTHIYFNQNILGHNIHNAVMSVHVKEDGKVFHVKNQFIPSAREKIASSIKTLNHEDAVKRVAQHVGIVGPMEIELAHRNSSDDVVFTAGNISREEITSKLVWQYIESIDGLRLAYDIAMDAVNGHDY